MYYEINVAWSNPKTNDRPAHLFATAERSITSVASLGIVLNAIRSRFKKEEGFVITVSEFKEIGNNITLKDTDKLEDIIKEFDKIK